MSTQTTQDSLNTLSKPIHILAKKFLDSGHIIFGGYVRDMIAGDTPVDLNICYCNTGLERLLRDFSKNFEITITGQDYKYAANNKGGVFALKTKFKFPMTGEVVKVDLIGSISILPDYSVNHLKLSKDSVSSFGKFTIIDVFKHINNRELHGDPGAKGFRDGNIPEHRTEKMLAKGYKLI